MAGAFPGEGEVLLGRELMEEAGISLGDAVNLLTPYGDSVEAVVSGEYDLGVSSLNRSWVLANIPLSQGLFGYGEGITSIEMQVKDPFTADQIASEVSSKIPNGLAVTNWKEQNASLLSGLSGQSISSLMIQVFVMISVVLGIASVLAISVMQKSRQIGILKAMGIKDSAASLIFVGQGFILGIFGALLGVGFGLGLSAMFTKLPSTRTARQWSHCTSIKTSSRFPRRSRSLRRCSPRSSRPGAPQSSIRWRSSKMDSIIALRQINKIYGAEIKTQVLTDVNLEIAPQSFNSIIGASGSGKSTLLNIIGTLDRPTTGEVYIAGVRTDGMRKNQLAELRNETIGFVFQFHYLLPEFTAYENVVMPFLVKRGRVTPEIQRRAMELMELMGLSKVAHNKATRMSGGQQQRAAIARALINNPKIILADEPTGNLDSESTETVYKILRDINEAFRTTFLIITHDRRIAQKTDRIIEIRDGKIALDLTNEPAA